MAAFSCNKEFQPQDAPCAAPKTIVARADADVTPDTRTSLSGTTVVWSGSDAIKGLALDSKVYASTKTTVESDGKKAVFEFSGLTVEDDLLALAYPADAVSDIDADYVYATLPSTQTATAGSFAPGANLAVAEGGEAEPQFKNVGGLLSLKINNDNIESVKLIANEPLTGDAGISCASATLAEATILDGICEVSLTGGLANGSTYYAVVYPGTYTGLKIVITAADGAVATYSNPNALTVGRNANLFIAELTVPDSKWEKVQAGETYTWNLASGDLSASADEVSKGEPELAWSTGYTWNTSDSFFAFDAGKGLQVGSAKKSCASLVLSTSGYAGYVETVKINFSHASSGGSSATVKVGGTAFKCEGSESVNGDVSAASYVFSGSELVKGDIVITFSNSAEKAFYIKSIEINPDERLDPAFSFEADSYTAYAGKTFTAPALSAASGFSGTVTWSLAEGSTAGAASVDPATGAVTIGSVAGKVTVVASFAGDEKYKPASASYTITVISGIVDVLNSSWTGISGTTYKDIELDGSASDAKYSLNAAGDNSSIQLRSKNSNSGIVTTVSGGTLKKVTITWNDATVDARVLDIYAKDSAYSSPADLYDSATQGTKVTSFTKSDGDGSYTFTTSYAYIGIRSNNGALYIDSIEIEWE